MLRGRRRDHPRRRHRRTRGGGRRRVFTPGASLAEIGDVARARPRRARAAPALVRTSCQTDDRPDESRRRWISSSTRASSTSHASASPCRPGGVADTVDEAVAVAERGRLPGRGQGPGPGGRTRQGRRRQARRERRRGAPARRATSSGLDIKGHVVRRLWIEHARDIAEEYYASLHPRPRRTRCTWACCRAQGGVEIEVVAEENPDAIADPARSTRSTAWTSATAATLGRRGRTRRGGARTGRRAAACKPLRLLHRGRLRPGRDQPADPHARPARSTPSTPRSPSTRTPPSATPSGRSSAPTETRRPREKMAKEKGLKYIGLDGTVGIIANGAGLAMSHARRRQPGRAARAANFLDIGGGANADVMAAALEVINTDPKVKVDLRQHLRRHHPRSTRSPRASSRRWAASRSTLAHRDPPRRHQRRARAARSSPRT